MRGMTYGKGLDDDAFGDLVEHLVKRLDKIAERFFNSAFGALIKVAPLIAQCSHWQYTRLRNEVGVKLGRVRKIGDLLDKIQLYGGGRMALHVARNGGITAKTFLALTPEERENLNNGSVLVRWRGDVVTVQAERLTDKQMATVVRSVECSLGAKILTPDEQSQPRPRAKRRLYEPVDIAIDDDGIVVTSQMGRSRFKTRFNADAIAQFQAVVRRLNAKTARTKRA